MRSNSSSAAVIEKILYQVLDTFPTTLAGMDRTGNTEWLFLTYQKRRVTVWWDPTKERIGVGLDDLDWETTNYWRAFERVIRLLAFGS